MLGSRSSVFYPGLVECEALPLWNVEGSCTLCSCLTWGCALKGRVPCIVVFTWGCVEGSCTLCSCFTWGCFSRGRVPCTVVFYLGECWGVYPVLKGRVHCAEVYCTLCSCFTSACLTFFLNCWLLWIAPRHTVTPNSQLLRLCQVIINWRNA